MNCFVLRELRSGPGRADRLPAARHAYVLIEAGRRIGWCLIPEIQPGLGGREVLLANRVNGEPLGAVAPCK
jgi:hypothetical protein